MAQVQGLLLQLQVDINGTSTSAGTAAAVTGGHGWHSTVTFRYTFFPYSLCIFVKIDMFTHTATCESPFMKAVHCTVLRDRILT